MLYEDYDNVTFFRSVMGIFSADFDKINHDNVNFDESDSDTIIHVRLLAWYNKFEKRKAYKTDLSKELMPVAWHQVGKW